MKKLFLLTLFLLFAVTILHASPQGHGKSEYFSSNVGIGVTNPSTKLSVNGGGAIKVAEFINATNPHISISSITSYGLAIACATSNGAYAGDSGTGDAIIRHEDTGKKIHFNFAANNAALTITNTNIGIGTTNPTDKLYVNGGATIAGNIVQYSGTNSGFETKWNADGGSAGKTTFLNRCQAAGGYAGGFIFQSTGTNVNNACILSLTGINGAVGIGLTQSTHKLEIVGGAYCDGTGDWIAGSDRAYKQNIIPLTKYGVKDVLRLEPVSYEHKKSTGVVQIGFIAQDVKPIIPEIVEGEDGSMGIAYARLTVVLVSAIQELSKENEYLKNRIEALESK